METNDTIKTISLANDDLSNLSIANNEIDETTKTINLENTKLKKYVQFNTLKKLVTLKPTTTIKYTFKKNITKFKWAFLHDILLFNDKTVLVLKKGDYIWNHIINFHTTDYYYLQYY